LPNDLHGVDLLSLQADKPYSRQGVAPWALA